MYTYHRHGALTRSFDADTRLELILQAGIDGVMGESWEDARGAVAATGYFTYLLGEPTPGAELDAILSAACPYGAVPMSAAWLEFLKDRSSVCYTRYKMAFQGFDFDRLRACAAALPEGITMHPVDRTLHLRGLVTDAAINIGHSFSDFEDYLTRGFGFAALDGGRPAALVSSYLVYRGEAEVDISTAPAYRRRGLATALCAAFLLECAKRHLAPSWDAQNPESRKLAEKLGFSLDHTYEVYALRRG